MPPRSLVAIGLGIPVSASTHVSTDPRIAEEAAHWLIDLEDSEADLAKFSAWLQASPRHVEEFLLVSAVWRAADGLDDAHIVEVDHLIAQALNNVQRFDEESTATLRTHDVRQRMRTALRSRLTAAVALFAVACAAWVGLEDRSVHYSTAVGEQRMVKLPDGSIVTLNTRSEIKVLIDDHQRTIELTSGEALFDVAHDAQRAFRVLAGEAVVKAVGTQFNVHRKDDGTTVGVVEGIVEMSSRGALEDQPRGDSGVAEAPERLTAGEQASMSVQGAVLRSSVEIDRLVAWRERRLVFRSESLASIVAEFNRYNETQLLIDGDATRARLITGVFDADNPGALVAFLERDRQLSVQTRGNNIVIRGP
jgi:transmembrane sensor